MPGAMGDEEDVQAWPEGTPLEVLNTCSGFECSRAECVALGAGPAGSASCARPASGTNESHAHFFMIFKEWSIKLYKLNYKNNIIKRQ